MSFYYWNAQGDRQRQRHTHSSDRGHLIFSGYTATATLSGCSASLQGTMGSDTSRTRSMPGKAGNEGLVVKSFLVAEFCGMEFQFWKLGNVLCGCDIFLESFGKLPGVQLADRDTPRIKSTKVEQTQPPAICQGGAL